MGATMTCEIAGCMRMAQVRWPQYGAWTCFFHDGGDIQRQMDVKAQQDAAAFTAPVYGVNVLGVGVAPAVGPQVPAAAATAVLAAVHAMLGPLAQAEYDHLCLHCQANQRRLLEALGAFAEEVDRFAEVVQDATRVGTGAGGGLPLIRGDDGRGAGGNGLGRHLPDGAAGDDASGRGLAPLPPLPEQAEELDGGAG